VRGERCEVRGERCEVRGRKLRDESKPKAKLESEARSFCEAESL